MSLVLTGAEVMQVLDMDLALAAAREAFRAYGEGRVNMPPKAYLTLAWGISGPCTAKFSPGGTRLRP
jgi:ornithine cyclodeaminase/alanine dehydrogenase-like protein (mu-crystallin family)